MYPGGGIALQTGCFELYSVWFTINYRGFWGQGESRKAFRFNLIREVHPCPMKSNHWKCGHLFLRTWRTQSWQLATDAGSALLQFLDTTKVEVEEEGTKWHSFSDEKEWPHRLMEWWQSLSLNAHGLSMEALQSTSSSTHKLLHIMNKTLLWTLKVLDVI